MKLFIKFVISCDYTDIISDFDYFYHFYDIYPQTKSNITSYHILPAHDMMFCAASEFGACLKVVDYEYLPFQVFYLTSSFSTIFLFFS